jgi:pyruvate/2-oxoglutarate/acetoin dehydrogenase E1 component
MGEHPDVLLIGEDLLDPYGGAFKVSRGLSTRFPDRVLATPISEAAIIGLGTGLSLRGMRPIVEIMFGDFLALGVDQILNHLAKFSWMYNGQVETPLVVRTAVGGHRGYGPTHSQSIEKMFLGVPQLVVVGVSLRHDPGELLRRAVEDRRPVLFLEQKILYAKRLEAKPPAGLVFAPHASEVGALYPTGTWRPQQTKADVTVVTYGAMTSIVEQAMARAFEDDELVCEYVVPSQLAPLRLAPILDSVARTGRLLVVEEGTTPWGFGAEVVAATVEALGAAGLRARRVGAHHLPIPNARPAEAAVLPDVDRVVDALCALVS